MTVAQNPARYLAKADQFRAHLRDAVASSFDPAATGGADNAERLHELITILHQDDCMDSLVAMRCNPRAARIILSMAYQYLLEVEASIFLDRPDLAELQQQHERD